VDQGSTDSPGWHTAWRGRIAAARRRRLALGAGLVLCAGLVLAGGALSARAAGPTAEPGARSVTEADCADLLRQFDVAWPSHRDAGKAAAAREARDRGEHECREHRYADGVHHLRSALRSIGVKPAKLIRKPEK